jgi:hypothetical protein
LIVFATSDKGGTGRSVTACNIAYRRALQGDDVAVLDFDFASPTAGAIFEIDEGERGIESRGLHTYLRQNVGDAAEIDVAARSAREDFAEMPPNSGRLVLYPGDLGGGEFGLTPDVVRRCTQLFHRLDQQYPVSIVDLSAGRSYALGLVLEVMARPDMRSIVSRWLVFHRWTRQHIIAASGLVEGRTGILEIGKAKGHEIDALQNSIRYVRTAKVGTDTPQPGIVKPTQAAWFLACDRRLRTLAGSRHLGDTAVLGEVPLDPVLQWREQIITDIDVRQEIANRGTVEAFESLARRLSDENYWEG